MVMTLAQYIPTVYTCQRGSSEEGYPPGTPNILEKLMDIPSLRDGPLAGGSHDPDLFLYCRCVAFLQTAYTYNVAAGKLYLEKPRYSFLD